MSNKNLIVNTPEPKPGILERGDLFAIAVGMVIGSGMVTLIGPAMAMTGYSVWLAYLIAIVMGFFMVFPYIILGGTMRVAGGPYSIVTNLSGVSAGGLVAYTKLVTPILNSSFALALGLYVNNLLPGITVKAIAVVGICILFVLNLLGMQEAARKQRLYREQPFVLGVDAKELYPEEEDGELILVQGIIDAYFEEPDGLVVLDYKTDKVRRKEELAERYQEQLRYYAKALEQMTGKKVKEKIIYSFTLKEGIYIK